MKRIVAVLAAVAMILALSACGGKSGSTQASAVGKSKGGTLRVTKAADLNNMDPQVLTDGLSMEALACCTEGLLNLDKAGNTVPGMAEKYEVSADGLTYTFHLRNSKWSNGDPVTAKDFVFAWQRLGSKELGSQYNYMLDVAAVKNYEDVLSGKKNPSELGVSAPDDKTFVVTLERPVPYFDKLAAFTPFFPVSESFVKKHGNQYGLTPETTLYNGAFLWKTWYSGSSFSFVKNPNYWNAAQINLDGIEFKVALEPQAAVLDYEAGNTDYVYLMGELVDKYQSSPGYDKQLGSYLWFLQTNHTRERLNNANLLKAISLAFNREQIANNVLHDGSIPGYFFVPKKLAFDKQGRDFRETAGDYFTEGKDKAKEYWEKAKAEMGVKTFNFELLFEDSEQSKKVSEFLKSEIESTLPGLTITMKSQPKKTRLQLMNEKKYDIGLTRWGPDYADPMTYLELFESAQNRGGYKDPAYDKLIVSAKSGKQSVEERWKTLIEAEKYLLSNGMGPMPVYQTGAAQLLNPKVKELYNMSVGIPFIYTYAYIEK